MTHDSIALVPATDSAMDALGVLAEAASGYVADASSTSTRKAYARDARAFAAWARDRHLVALPAEPTTVGLYLVFLAEAGKKVSTIERALAAIAAAHRAADAPWTKSHPAIRDVMRGIRRRLGVAPLRKTPVLGDQLVRMVAPLGVDVAGLRDRALLALGWFGAFRRSELVALDVADVRFVTEGMIVAIRRSKTDQEGHGTEKGIPFAGNAAVCPVRALRAWLDAASLTHGPLFRAVDRHGNVAPERMSDRSVARIVQRVAGAAGIEANVAGHSLRAGFATTAAAKGKSLDAIMRQTGHRSERVARTYVRHGTVFVDNAAAGLV